MNDGSWWWAWLVLGFVLLIGELLTSGVFLLFFGLSGLVVGGLVAFGVGGPLWFQLVLFAGLATLSLLLLRRPLLARFRSPAKNSAKIEAGGLSEAVLLDDLPAGATGRAEMQGTTWKVTNVGGVQLSRGTSMAVERTEGLTLMIRPLEKGTSHV